MKTPKFKLGCLSLIRPIEEMFEAASESGFSHIEIDLLEKHSCIESFNAKRIRKIVKQAAKYNISISLHIPYTLNPSDEILSIRRANVEYLEKTIKLAHKIKATHITTHIGYYVGLPSWKWKRKKALDRLILSLKEVFPLCSKLEVVLAIENVNPMPKDSEFFYLGDSINDLNYIFSKLKSPFLKLCLDVGHANTNEGPIKYIEEFADKIVSVHVHDNKGKYDEHLVIGTGTINWSSLADEFKKIKFYGPFVYEVVSRTLQKSREDLEKHLKLL
ncbi:MAG: sugar phosphate isomerase/epimerase [Candidatus Bathyarchaeia archaeon]|jgi:sugar phosphate isomerase/epimerase